MCNSCVGGHTGGCIRLKEPALTFSSSLASCIRSSGLFFLRYERRLPLAMNGITMEGVLVASKHMPIRVITWGWWKSCIFRISFIMPERSLSVNRPNHFMKNNVCLEDNTHTHNRVSNINWGGGGGQVPMPMHKHIPFKVLIATTSSVKGFP